MVIAGGVGVTLWSFFYDTGFTTYIDWRAPVSSLIICKLRTTRKFSASYLVTKFNSVHEDTNDLVKIEIYFRRIFDRGTLEK